MPTKTDPRAEFKGRTHDELKEELEELSERQHRLAQDVARARPTREEVQAKIRAAQERAAGWLDAHAERALDAITNAVPSARGFQEAEKAATFAVLGSDSFAAALTGHAAAKRKSEAEVAPIRDELGGVRRRIEALNTELALRELDDQRAREVEQRAALEERLTGGGPVAA